MARIFVIDDDEQLLRMVGLMLERGGHNITLINNPLDGLEQIKADKPDLLVLDVMMPNMSGHDLAREIRADANIEELPILVLTARSQEVDRTTALKSGADDYLSKPVTSQELMERVDNLLAKKGGQTSPETGIIITAFGLRGGVGQTTLAVNLAAALPGQPTRSLSGRSFTLRRASGDAHASASPLILARFACRERTGLGRAQESPHHSSLWAAGAGRTGQTTRPIIHFRRSGASYS